MEKPACETCTALAREYGEEPGCHECIPPVMPENRTAVQVWNVCRGQVLIATRSIDAPGGGRMIETYARDIDIRAVDAVMAMMGIGDRLGCLEKVKTLHDAHQEAMEAKRMGGK